MSWGIEYLDLVYRLSGLSEFSAFGGIPRLFNMLSAPPTWWLRLASYTSIVLGSTFIVFPALLNRFLFDFSPDTPASELRM